MDISARIRYYHFISGVLATQQHDPLCSVCKAFTNSVLDVRRTLDVLMPGNAAEISGVSIPLFHMIAEAKTMLSGLNPLPDAAGQKKAGNCTLPKGVCFVKSSKALYEKMEQAS